ncbi:styrene monooxygenase/indole monooxygenase family protein [Streptomyces griseoviridis]|uniref:2-polyprenyl-6-methoxyphenol hydroxylase-like FAD-dependent oxidoreductase n=1 Tax=Streptomyces griseoviridis TaxID=45398 RepID=A0ABT9L7S9_STRGD|nr:styrene monooxygenase/indole monooxygenase family protein [Streptomyces griseoviridis]MDP9679768.1 2-polyprenyl-6-methoxyphenol hydroxylase-like FAD-dependent oxidoreductase [Streptomyces griseoviridis]GGT22267.1 alanine-phosphoribitol ligase [Streptomyces griseoviridis]
MPDIGIIGAGVAGLHLGLLLRRHDIPVTLYSDRTPAQIAAGPLPATVAHHAPTLRREAALGVGFWPADTYGYTCHHHYVGGPRPLTFRGDFTSPSCGVDHRLVLPALTDVFQDRGGELRTGRVAADDLAGLAARHDLLVVATGRGPLADLFPRLDGPGSATAPRRRLCAGLYHGVAPAEPKGVTLSLAPGRGELIEIPLYSGHGHVTALLFECVPGGGADALCALDQRAGPAAFDRAVRAELAAHHPTVFARTDPARFGLTGPLDLVRTAITPTVRADWAELPGGRYALALGDAHTVVDPIVGQGANTASYSAEVVADAVLDDPVLDELFCRRVARRRAEVVLGAARWSEFMLRPPEHVRRLLGAMSECRSAADEFTDNFGRPDRQWRLLATPERTRAFLARHGVLPG